MSEFKNNNVPNVLKKYPNIEMFYSLLQISSAATKLSLLGKLTNDQIYTSRQILPKCREREIPTHHLCIDFKATYDTIDRNELWNIIQELPWLVDPAVRGLHEWGAIQGESVELDVGIIQISDESGV